MTETDAPAKPDAEAAKPAAAAQPSPSPPLGRRLGPVLLILCGVVLVAMTVGWIVARRDMLASSGATGAELAALRAQVATEQARVAALSARVQALAARPAPDTTQLAGQLGALAQRVAALEARPAGGDTTALAASVAALSQKVASIARESQDATKRLARIEAARAALDAGQPLGTIPGAPPALARYATTAPPTEAGLRESFNAAAAAALAASRPAEPAGLLPRLTQRAESLLTVRIGGKVVAGPPAAAPLNAARQRLDSGDLAGALAALAPLDPAAARAMGHWTSEARALLAARAALNAMASEGANGGAGGAAPPGSGASAG